MATDPNPTLQAELVAARDALAPEIRGLHDLSAVSISGDLAAAVQQRTTICERRRNLLQSALDAYDALVACLAALDMDGYPDIAPASLGGNLFAELQGENTDLQAAMAAFRPEPASQIAVAFGEPAART